MRIDHIVHITAIALGAILAWPLLRSRWPGWKAAPLLLLLVQFINDLGVAPLVFDLSGYKYRAGSMYERAHGWEALRAGGLILLCYLMIAGGLISVRLLSARSGKSQPLRQGAHHCPHVIDRAWLVSLLLFAIGSAVNVLIICQLLREKSIAAITFEKALVTDDTLVASATYHILRLLGHLMVIGALGMVSFSKGGRLKVQAGTAAVLLAVGVAALHGQRQGIITAMLCCVLLYREAVGVIPLRHMAFYMIVSMSVLGAVAHTRGFNLKAAGSLGGISIFRVLRATVVGYSRIDDTAWVMRTVPDAMPYTGVLNAAATLGRFAPSLRIPGTDTLYGHVVAHFHGGVNPAGGIGGTNYATAAELYAWGGWLSVVVFGYLIGLFFGAIFEWERRSMSNPFLTFLVVLVSVRVFFFGVQARMPNILHEVGVYVLAVAVMAALSVPSRRTVPFLLLLWWNVIPLLIWKAFDLDVLRIALLSSVPLLYLWAVQSLRIAGAWFRSGIPLPHGEQGALGATSPAEPHSVAANAGSSL